MAAKNHPKQPSPRGNPKPPGQSYPELTVTDPAPASPYAPYMGVDTWYAFGTSINERTVVKFARTVVRDRLQSADYRYVWLDGGWWNGTRDATGNVVTSPSQWPHGMAWLVSYIHSLGLHAGIYTDAGASDCGGGKAGSYGHYQQDVNMFAAWGFDAVKVDFCGGDFLHADPRVLYGQFAQAIAADEPRRAITLNICDAAEPGHYARSWPTYEDSAFDTWSFAPAIATSWRTSYDVGAPGHVPFKNVLHNLDAAAAHPEVAGRGHFTDPDYLAPGQGMSFTESRAQFSMWTVLTAPLMLSTNPASLSPAMLAMLKNPEAIAISQDPNGIQGARVALEGAAELWVKPLAKGQKAVAFLNRSRVPVRAYATGGMIGLPGASRLAVRDVWAHQTTVQTGALRATVPAHGAALLRVAAA